MRDYTTTCKFWSHLAIRIFIRLRCMHFQNAPKLVYVLPVPIIKSTVIFPVIAIFTMVTSFFCCNTIAPVSQVLASVTLLLWLLVVGNLREQIVGGLYCD